MKFIKNIIPVSLVAIVTLIVVYGGYNIYALSGPTSTRGPLTTFFAKNEYHGKMNAYFNKKIEKLNEVLEEKDFFTSEKFIAPTNIDPINDNFNTILEKCGEDNVSTYCVSMGALDIYIQYVTSLNRLLGAPVRPDGDYFTVEDVLNASRRGSDEIHDEIEYSRKVMRATIAIYNEYKLAYPMHKKYREIISNLIKYRTVVKDISRQTTHFPIKFIDATSSTCD